jgi:RNA polymerase sigma factor (sigma-70 family)
MAIPDAVDEEAEVRAAIERNDRRTALRLLVRDLGTPVYRYCRQMVGDDALADDVHQTVFAEVFEHLGSFEGPSSVRSWVFTIAHHRALDAIKKSQRFHRRFAVRDDQPDMVDPAPAAPDRLFAHTAASVVNRCLQRLAPHVRMAVLLHYQEEYSYKDMERICRERAGTLQARVARAMPLLRRCIEEHGAVHE